MTEETTQVAEQEPPRALQTTTPMSRTAVQISTEDIIALKAVLDPSMTDPELRLLAAYATRTGLDPISKQIYSSHIDGRQVIMVAIDGFRVVAERSNKYKGQGQVVFGDNCSCGVERYGKHPEWAEVPIYREGFEEAVSRRAYFHEYVPTPKGWAPGANWPQEWNRDSMWRKMPRNMISKCSEALGLRVAFPNDLGSMYIAEEMDQAGERMTVDVTPAVSAASAAVAAIPEGSSGSELPEGLEHQGVVFKVADGIRMVKPPKWAEGKDYPEPVAKFEVAFKIGRRRHTAIPLDTIARNIEALGIQVDDTVACDGKIVELDWPGRGDKPKKKGNHGVSKLAVMRGGEWQVAGIAPAEAATPPGEPSQSSSGASSQEPPTAAPSEPSGLSPTATPASEDSTGSSTRSATPSSSSSGDGSTVEASPLPDADVDPSRGGSTDSSVALVGEVLDPTSPEAPDGSSDQARSSETTAEPPAPAASVDMSAAMALSVWGNEKGSALDMQAIVIELKPSQTTAGLPFMHGWFKHAEDPVRFEAVMSDEEAKAQSVYGMVPGQVVRVIGTWTMANARQIVMLTAMVEAS